MKKIKAYETYQGAIDAERHREKQWRRTKQGAFESSFVSFEETSEGYYPLAAVVRRAYDQDSCKAHQSYSRAYKRVLRQAPECLEVFKLIIKNGKERQKSIWEMIRRIKTRRAPSTTSSKHSSKTRSVSTMSLKTSTIVIATNCSRHLPTQGTRSSAVKKVEKTFRANKIRGETHVSPLVFSLRDANFFQNLSLYRCRGVEALGNPNNERNKMWWVG